MPRTPSPRLLSRVATFARSLLTGAGATLADLGVIAFAVGLLRVSPAVANVPALLAGAVVQFLGNRHFAFRASSGSLRRQVGLFAVTEAVTLVLNALLYHLVVTHVALGTSGAVVARAITSNAVFLLWSYPVWQRVFASVPGKGSRPFPPTSQARLGPPYPELLAPAETTARAPSAPDLLAFQRAC